MVPEFDRQTLERAVSDIGGALREEPDGTLIVSHPEWGGEDPVTVTPEGRYILEGWTWQYDKEGE